MHITSFLAQEHAARRKGCQEAKGYERDPYASGYPAFPFPRALTYTGVMPLPTAHEVSPGDATHVALLRHA
jgi:hypothetical protein